MKQVTTYVGIDAHKKDLFIAMLIGNESKPVTWQLGNEPNAVRRLVRKLEREAPGPPRGASWYRYRCERTGLWSYVVACVNLCTSGHVVAPRQQPQTLSLEGEGCAPARGTVDGQRTSARPRRCCGDDA
jgi:hypothetical protein